MANPNRKMATMRRVSKVEPIEDADRVEAVHVDGWVVVDQKGVWHEGDLCVYFEPDSAMPTNDPRYSHMAQWGEKTMTIKGVPTVVHVLRTRRFRGVYSQGYVAKPEDVLPDTVPERAYEVMFERKARLDGICGVCEYHPDENSLAAGFIGRYDPFVAPRTDAERAENVDAETFDLMRHADYFASVKVDGTSTTIVFDKRTGAFEAYSHNNHYDLSTGLGLTTKTVADQQGLTKWCEEHPGISLGCELCGPKIQSDRLGLGKHRLFVFSVWDMDGRRYLNPYDYPELVPNCVPLLEDFTLNRFDGPSDLVDWVDGIRSNVTKGRLDEGVVIHAIGKGDLSDSEWARLVGALGSTVQIKAISKKYLLKSK